MIDALTIFTITVTLLALIGVVIINHQTQRKVMAKISELSEKLDPIISGLTEVGEQLDKAKTEIIAALGGEAEIPAEALAKLEALSTVAGSLKAAAQALDDLNPDGPAPEQT